MNESKNRPLSSHSQPSSTGKRISVSSSSPGFAPIPKRLLTDERITSPTTIAVYAALASFIGSEGRCWPYLATIGKRARCDKRTVLRHIEILVGLGYIQRRSGRASGRANIYHLVSAWGASMSRGSVTSVTGGTTPVSRGHDTGVVGGASPCRTLNDIQRTRLSN